MHLTMCSRGLRSTNDTQTKELKSLRPKRVVSNSKQHTAKYEQWHSPDTTSDSTSTFLARQIAQQWNYKWHKNHHVKVSVWAKRVTSNINFKTKYEQWHSPDTKSILTSTFSARQIDLQLDYKWHKNHHVKVSVWAKRVTTNINLQTAKYKQWHSPDTKSILESAIFALQIAQQLDFIVVRDDDVSSPLAVTTVSERESLWMIILFHCFECSNRTFCRTITMAKKVNAGEKQVLFKRLWLKYYNYLNKRRISSKSISLI